MGSLFTALKGAFKSKTVWAGVLAIVAPVFFTTVDDWIKAHPGTSAQILGAVMIGLRAVTTTSLADKVAPTPPAA